MPRRSGPRSLPPAPGKTYTLMGATKGGTVQSRRPSRLMEQRERVRACPDVVRRGLGRLPRRPGRLQCAWASLLPAPLEEAANPAVTPNPAKAPWYFLWLQELVSILTFRIGDTVDRRRLHRRHPDAGTARRRCSPSGHSSTGARAAAAGVWFHASRKRQNRVFLVLLGAAVVLTIIGTFFRGPYWAWVWPWDPTSPVH